MSRFRLALTTIIVLLCIVGGVFLIPRQETSHTNHPSPPASSSRIPSYHLVATRQRGDILFQLETWYIDDEHQRTDVKVTLPTGEKVTTGNIINGVESWSYRVEPEKAGMTRGVHMTRKSKATGRYLFVPGKITDIVTAYKQQGCHITQEQNTVSILNQEATVITIAPTLRCTGQQFDIPNNALIDNNINYYQTPGTGVKKSAPGPMTIWIDKKTTVVLQAQRTTANNVAWDQYKVTSIEYTPKLPDHLFDYTPPPGMIVITNPGG